MLLLHLGQVRHGVSEDLLRGLAICPLEFGELRTKVECLPGEILRSENDQGCREGKVFLMD